MQVSKSRYFSTGNVSKRCVSYCPTTDNSFTKLQCNVPLTRSPSAIAESLVWLQSAVCCIIIHCLVYGRRCWSIVPRCSVLHTARHSRQRISLRLLRDNTPTTAQRSSFQCIARRTDRIALHSLRQYIMYFRDKEFMHIRTLCTLYVYANESASCWLIRCSVVVG